MGASTAGDLIVHYLLFCCNRPCFTFDRNWRTELGDDSVFRFKTYKLQSFLNTVRDPSNCAFQRARDKAGSTTPNSTTKKCMTTPNSYAEQKHARKRCDHVIA